MKTQQKLNLLSVVVPVYNEAAGIDNFCASLVKELEGLGVDFEVIFVDDGSADDSRKVLLSLARSNPKLHIISLSRNFGKEIATTAGIHASKGDAVVILDADGQHPVEIIPEFIHSYEQGADVVIGVRKANSGEGFIKKFGSKFFYMILKSIGVTNAIPGSTDFRLISKEVAQEFSKLTEHNRVTRALIDWLGFERKIVYFVAKPRQYGEASYSVKKLTQLALNGFVSLSFAPLYFSGYMGVIITILSFIAAVFVTIETYLLDDPLNLNITGTAFLAFLILFLVGILLIGQGLLALYVARIYTETQNRPLYIKR